MLLCGPARAPTHTTGGKLPAQGLQGPAGPLEVSQAMDDLLKPSGPVVTWGSPVEREPSNIQLEKWEKYWEACSRQCSNVDPIPGQSGSVACAVNPSWRVMSTKPIENSHRTKTKIMSDRKQPIFCSFMSPFASWRSAVRGGAVHCSSTQEIAMWGHNYRETYGVINYMLFPRVCTVFTLYLFSNVWWYNMV